MIYGQVGYVSLEDSEVLEDRMCEWCEVRFWNPRKVLMLKVEEVEADEPKLKMMIEVRTESVLRLLVTTVSVCLSEIESWHVLEPSVSGWGEVTEKAESHLYSLGRWNTGLRTYHFYYLASSKVLGSTTIADPLYDGGHSRLVAQTVDGLSMLLRLPLTVA